jgi:putative transferase (TIGR04331 family)
MILQTTGGFNPRQFGDTLFPLGPWCAQANTNPQRTALNLPSEEDLDLESITSSLMSIIGEQLYPTLNEVHNVDFSKSVWNHSLGTYLRVLAPLVITRYNLVRRVVQHLPCDEFTQVSVDQARVITNDRTELLVSINSHAWNHQLFSELCTSLNLKPKMPIEATWITTPDPSASRSLHAESSGSIKKLVMSLCNFRASHSRNLLIRTMLPTHLEFALALRMKTLPYFWSEDISHTSHIDQDMRHRLEEAVHGRDGHEQVLLRTIVKRLPRVFVEDFALAREVAAARLPQAPKRVFTSNLHQSSDVFLLWLSEKKDRGTQVTIAQHGGVHSLCRDLPADIASEINLADRYIAWGNRSFVSPKVSSGPTLVNIGVKRLTRPMDSNDGPLLIVLDASYRYPSIPRGMNGSRFRYAELVNDLISKLDTETINRIVLRPYRGSEIWDDPLIELVTSDPRVEIDSSFPPIKSLYSKSKMVVSTSLGTTFFQTLHHRIPTAILLDRTLSPLSDWAQRGLDPLRQSSVLFSDPTQLASHINQTFSDLSDWWGGTTVQSAINQFESEMSPTCSSPIRFFHNQLMTGRRTT